MIRLYKALRGYSLSEARFFAEVEAFVARNGGAAGIATRMDQMGMGLLARAWMIDGATDPIYGEQLHRLFGTDVLRAWAAHLDLSPHDCVRRLSRALPLILARIAPPGSGACPCVT